MIVKTNTEMKSNLIFLTCFFLWEGWGGVRSNPFFERNVKFDFQ